MTDFNSNTTMVGTLNTDPNPSSDAATEPPPMETVAQSSKTVDEKAYVPPEMMQAEPPHGEAEQTEAERSSTTGPLMTQADAPADVSAEAVAEPAPHEPNNASSDGLDHQAAWDTGLAAELAMAQPEPREPEPEAQDVYDAVAPDTEDTVVETTAEVAPQTVQDGDVSEQDPMLAGKNGNADLAIELMKKRMTFFHTREKEPYALFWNKDHMEVLPTRGEDFDLCFGHLYYRYTGSAIKKSALSAVKREAKAIALYDGREVDVGIRVAKFEHAIYVDLVNAKWQQIEITTDGWRIIELKDSPVRFKRPKGMRPLPYPERDGDLKRIRDVFNLQSQSDLCLVLSWMVGALHPTGPYPILIIQGEQGTGKSFLTKCIRSLLDPSTVPNRTLPRTERDLAISAENARLLCYDNVSRIKDTLSDAFCRISTGGGFGTRVLYEDTTEVLFNSTRPMIFNGISDLVVKHDFADRSLVVTLQPIRAGHRKPESLIKREWEAIRPSLFGALCDAVKEALSNYEDVRLDRSPRMADFAIWVSAAEPALPWERGQFMAEFEKNRFELIEVAIESDPISLAIMEMMDRLKGKVWIGTPTQLLNDLAGYVPNNGARKKGWPQAPNIFTNRLRRVQTFLRAKGIEIEHSKSGKRLIRLWKRDAEQSESAEREELHLAAGGM